ncbi:Mis12-domain-containing protein [Cylindrobasidium torrendii FP15055 ss-10]|uniref:Mis12-domain-containing protein n=1 Tax=Cylindrobasidium torrendii FP15055 ss-10 TaxID=1314674 RepID=A0A0D7BRV3_9AGAR|nr:Mis12-domain-containing protein [Cylindrobasidium torrendii FP15055 ss-10]
MSIAEAGPSSLLANEADRSGDESPTPPLLLVELLGFHPQLLLDDIISIANAAIEEGLDGFEEYITNWADKQEGNYDSEIERGLAALQTLLEHHTDMAYDRFETWALRNVFFVPKEIEIVVPQQIGLEMDATAEQEQALLDEIEEMRKRIRDESTTKRNLKKAIHLTRGRNAIAKQRLQYLQPLDIDMREIASLPSKLMALYNALLRLPDFDSGHAAAIQRLQLPDPGKRPWETGKIGYLNWAVEELVTQQRDSETTQEREAAGATAGQLKQLLHTLNVLNEVKKTIGDERMDTS